MISTEQLRRYPCFTGASEDSLRALAMNSEELSFDAGQVLFNEGDPADHLFILLKGEVDIRYVLADGEQRTVDTRVKDDILLWSSVIEPYRTTAVAVARQNTRVLAINAATLRELRTKDDKLERSLMNQIALVISQRLQGARVQLATMS